MVLWGCSGLPLNGNLKFHELCVKSECFIKLCTQFQRKQIMSAFVAICFCTPLIERTYLFHRWFKAKMKVTSCLGRPTALKPRHILVLSHPQVLCQLVFALYDFLCALLCDGTLT